MPYVRHPLLTMWKSLVETAKVKLPPTIVGLIMGLSTPFWLELLPFIETSILPQLSPRAVLSLLASLMVLVLSLVYLLYEAHSMDRKIGRYEPDPEFHGCWRHRRRHKERVCAACLMDGRITPVHPRSGDRVYCPRRDCGQRVSESSGYGVFSV